jgi:Cu/Ag efflux pump CusA
LRDVSTDQQSNATAATLTIDRDTAGRFGVQPQVIDDTLYDAFGQRWVTQYFTLIASFACGIASCTIAVGEATPPMIFGRPICCTTRTP